MSQSNISEQAQVVFMDISNTTSVSVPPPTSNNNNTSNPIFPNATTSSSTAWPNPNSNSNSSTAQLCMTVPLPPPSHNNFYRLRASFEEAQRTIQLLQQQFKKLHHLPPQRPAPETRHLHLYKGPKFTRNLDPPIEEFFYNLSNHFNLFHICNDEIQCQLLLDACSSSAAAILQQALRNTLVTTYTRFDDLCDILIHQFRDHTRHEHAANQIQTIRQTGNILGFNSLFTKLLINLDSCPSNAELIWIYCNAIQWLFADHIFNHNPTTIEDAMAIAAQHEQKRIAHKVAKANS
jgi:hypothetical protein